MKKYLVQAVVIMILFTIPFIAGLLVANHKPMSLISTIVVVVAVMIYTLILLAIKDFIAPSPPKIRKDQLKD